MELYQLRYFLETARSRNFTEASLRLHIAQSALSQQIQSLEEELGVQLFQRGKRESTLTAAGSSFVTEVEKLLRQSDELVAFGRALAGGVRGKLRLAAIPSLSAYWFPEFLERFRSEFPQVDLSLREGSSTQIAAMVAASEVEAGFVQLPCDFPGVKSELLFTEALALLVSAEDPLVSRKKVEVRHLEKRPMILYRGQLRLQVLELCRASGFEPVVACECEELETVRALVRSGLGVAIIPEIAAKPLLADPRTKALRLDKGLRRSVGVITRLHFPESTPLRHFLSLLSPRGVS